MEDAIFIVFRPVTIVFDHPWLAFVLAATFAGWSFAYRVSARVAGIFARWMPRIAAIIWLVFPVYEWRAEIEAPHSFMRMDLLFLTFPLYALTVLAVIA